MMNTSTHESVRSAPNLDLLESFCRDELAATQTYEKALTLPVLKKHSAVLNSCYESHRARATVLAQRIGAFGGKVPESPGIWGALVPALTGAAAAVSEHLAISLLEESEDRGLKHYRGKLDELESLNRDFILERVLPAQNSTHASLSSLKHSLE
jgi:demethoxyubiquinone hydroxylase (CLK1/Coq7/Cat5 family)